MSGSKLSDFDIGPLLFKRLRIEGTTLRSRSAEYQAKLLQDLMKDAMDKVRSSHLHRELTRSARRQFTQRHEDGGFQIILHQTYSVKDIARATQDMQDDSAHASLPRRRDRTAPHRKHRQAGGPRRLVIHVHVGMQVLNVQVECLCPPRTISRGHELAELNDDGLEGLPHAAHRFGRPGVSRVAEYAARLALPLAAIDVDDLARAEERPTDELGVDGGGLVAETSFELVGEDQVEPADRGRRGAVVPAGEVMKPRRR
jgi:hypothetical protein